MLNVILRQWVCVLDSRKMACQHVHVHVHVMSCPRPVFASMLLRGVDANGHKSSGDPPSQSSSFLRKTNKIKHHKHSTPIDTQNETKTASKNRVSHSSASVQLVESLLPHFWAHPSAWSRCHAYVDIVESCPMFIINSLWAQPLYTAINARPQKQQSGPVTMLCVRSNFRIGSWRETRSNHTWEDSCPHVLKHFPPKKRACSGIVHVNSSTRVEVMWSSDKVTFLLWCPCHLHSNCLPNFSRSRWLPPLRFFPSYLVACLTGKAFWELNFPGSGK